MGSEHAYKQPAAAWSACDEVQAKQQHNHNSQGRGSGQDYKRRIRSSDDQRSSSKLHRSPYHSHPPDNVNTDESIKIGLEHMAELEIWMANKTLNKNLALMTSTNKIIKLDGKPVYDTELIYTRVICIQQYRDIDITDVLSYKLSPSLFAESRNVRAQSNAVLKTKLQVGQASQIQWVPDAVIIDGCAMLWNVHWRTSGTVVAYLINFIDFIRFIWNALTSTDIWRYVGNSTKQMTRSSRPGNDASRKHQRNLHTTLATQNVTLNST